MSEFNIDVEELNKVMVVRTSGYLDDGGGKIFGDKLEELISKGNIYYVFNLAQTPVINSTGLSTLLDVMVQIIDYNDGEVSITGLSKLTETALQMTGVLTLCDSYTTEEEAVAAVAKFANQ